MSTTPLAKKIQKNAKIKIRYNYCIEDTLKLDGAMINQKDLNLDFKLVIDSRVVLAEMPVWDARINKLYWIDTVGSIVHRYDPATGKDESRAINASLGAAVPCTSLDKVMVAVDNGMMLLDFVTGEMELIAQPQPNTGEFGYNDTRCDPVGRIFTSSVSKHYTEPGFDPKTMAGKFYVIEPDGRIVTLAEDVAQYNTIFLDKKCKNLYAVETYYKKLLRYDYTLEKGASGSPETVIEFEEMPDGVSVDVENNIYVCQWGSQQHITVWSLDDYSQVGSIPFPVKHICCGGFGGKDMKDFYVATSKFWLAEGDPDFAAGAGGIFCARSTIAGIPEYFFRDDQFRKAK